MLAVTINSHLKEGPLSKANYTHSLPLIASKLHALIVHECRNYMSGNYMMCGNYHVYVVF